MYLLIIGIALWSSVHLIPSLTPGLKIKLTNTLGENGYKGSFATTIILSIVLMVFGWQAVEPEIVFILPDWIKWVTAGLMVIAIWLMTLTAANTNVIRYLRHPQLSGMVVLSVAHCLVNGDNRSLVLFVSLGIWALIEIYAINRRQGAWRRPETVPLSAEIKPILLTVVVYSVLLFIHPYVFGVSVLGM